jgi:hypothetical protein
MASWFVISRGYRAPRVLWQKIVCFFWRWAPIYLSRKRQNVILDQDREGKSVDYYCIKHRKFVGHKRAQRYCMHNKGRPCPIDLRIIA